MIRGISERLHRFPVPALLAGLGLGLILIQVIGLYDIMIGYVLIVASVVVALAMGKRVTLGPKWAWMPLGIIVGVVVVRAIVYSGEQAVYEMGFMGLLVAAYIAARVAGKEIFWAAAPVVVLVSFASIVYAGLNWATWPDEVSGLYNYNLVVAVLVLGTILSTWHRKWILVAVALPAIFLTGASEGIVVLVVVGALVLLRRDWNKRALVPIALTGCLIIGAFATGFGQLAYDRTAHIAQGATSEVEDATALTDRVDGYKLALEDIALLGHGYSPQDTATPDVSPTSIHNTPLRILYELGPIAMVAWVFVMVAGLVKTRWKYAFGAIMAFGLFDHLMWTWLAPFAWAIVGVSTLDNEGDSLFRKEG